MLKNKQIKDILPENNNTNVIPQILVNNGTDFIYLASILQDYGYDELNLNLGCPYPMVTNRELGAGLLPHPTIVLKMLDEAMGKISIRVSIKIRTGLTDNTDIVKLLPELNNYSLSEIIIHPRIAKQLYRGSVNLESFNECLSLSKHNIAYNGDIVTYNDFNVLRSKFKKIGHFMIGRGLLWNPFLAKQIKQNGELIFNVEETKKMLFQFHKNIYQYNKNSTSGNTHLMNKMQQFWSYFAFVFEQPKKVIKSIKKCKNEKMYFSIIDQTFITSNLNYNNN